MKLEDADMGYAFLTAISNATNMIEGVIGAGVYWLFSRLWMTWVVQGLRGSILDIARTANERTPILEVFVYISLLFPFLALLFLILLKRELARRGVTIRLGGSAPAASGRAR